MTLKVKIDFGWSGIGGFYSSTSSQKLSVVLGVGIVAYTQMWGGVIYYQNELLIYSELLKKTGFHCYKSRHFAYRKNRVKIFIFKDVLPA